MSTIQHPQLPPPGEGPGVAQYQAAGAPGVYMGPPPSMVPPMPPRGRSAGFWVGITAAITAGIVAALLVGFFIGRGTRLSNDTVQSKLTQQQQADLIVQQKALNDLHETDLNRQRKLVAAARASGERNGRSAGRAQGRQEGFESGQQSGYSQGQTAGYSQGQTDGYSQGINTGSCMADYLYC